MKYIWKMLLLFAIVLNFIAYIFNHNSDCFTAACSLSIIYVIFLVDEKKK